MPLGGLALMDTLPRRPRDEILIALAGPAVNLILAALAFGLLAARGASLGVDALLDGGLTARFLSANLVLALFNLVPAFPLDGGRVFRALLATRLSYLRATERAVLVGRVLAGLLILVPVLHPSALMLGLIGVFLLVAGGRELRGVRLDELLHHSRVEDHLDPAPWLMATRDTSMAEIGAALSAREDLEWALVDMEGGRFGLLSRRELLSACLAMPPQLPLCRLVGNPLRALPAGATVAARDGFDARLLAGSCTGGNSSLICGSG